jgi:2-dehydro-3-deoxyphosphooctonate aldolase (KDO 8-P synthase)
LLQIPAAVCRPADLLIEAARTGRPVNIEKGPLIAPMEAIGLLDLVASVGNWNVMLTECGTSSDHDRLVVDVRDMTIMRETGFPLVFDAGPRPDAANLDVQSRRRAAREVAESALTVGLDGIALFVEDETETRAAPFGTAGISLASLPGLLHRLKEIEQTVKSA